MSFVLKAYYMVRSAYWFYLYAKQKIQLLIGNEENENGIGIQKVYQYYRGIVTLLHIVSGQSLNEEIKNGLLTMLPAEDDCIVSEQGQERFKYSTYIVLCRKLSVLDLKFLTLLLMDESRVLRVRVVQGNRDFLDTITSGQSEFLHQMIDAEEKSFKLWLEYIKSKGNIKFSITKSSHNNYLRTLTPERIVVKEKDAKTNKTSSKALTYNFQETIGLLNHLGYFNAEEFESFNIENIRKSSWSAIPKKGYNYDETKELYFHEYEDEDEDKDEVVETETLRSNRKLFEEDEDDVVEETYNQMNELNLIDPIVSASSTSSSTLKALVPYNSNLSSRGELELAPSSSSSSFSYRNYFKSQLSAVIDESLKVERKRRNVIKDLIIDMTTDEVLNYAEIYTEIYRELFEKYRMEGDGYKDGRKMDNFGKSLKRIMYRAGKEQIFTRIKILFLDNEEFFKSVWIHSKDKWKSLLGNSKIAESFANYIPLAKRLFKNEYHVDKDQSEEATIEYLLSVFKMITEQLKLEMGWEMESYEEEGEADESYYIEDNDEEGMDERTTRKRTVKSLFAGTASKKFGHRKKVKTSGEENNNQKSVGEKKWLTEKSVGEEEKLEIATKGLFETPTKKDPNDLQQVYDQVVRLFECIFSLNNCWRPLKCQETIDEFVNLIKIGDKSPTHFLNVLQSARIWSYYAMQKDNSSITETSPALSFLRAHYKVMEELVKKTSSAEDSEDLLKFAKQDAAEMLQKFPHDAGAEKYFAKLNQIELSTSSNEPLAATVSFFEEEFTVPFLWKHRYSPSLQMLNLFVEQEENLYLLKEVLIFGEIQIQPFYWKEVVNQAQYSMFIDASGKVDLVPGNSSRSEDFFIACREIITIMIDAMEKAESLDIGDLDWLADNYFKGGMATTNSTSTSTSGLTSGATLRGSSPFLQERTDSVPKRKVIELQSKIRELGEDFFSVEQIEKLNEMFNNILV